ncbi:MAG: hypothetical protein FWD60_12880 [Candidatus Azobacteroides sp.]|nr:hypothetical protein [Candidatus Azobacteroides sp.]
MDIQFSDVANVLMTAIAGAVGWFIGLKKQRNDFLSALQSSIDLLSEKNRQLVEEVVLSREENARVRSEVVKLREENKALRSEIETLNKKLENIKTITKKG